MPSVLTTCLQYSIVVLPTLTSLLPRIKMKTGRWQFFLSLYVLLMVLFTVLHRISLFLSASMLKSKSIIPASSTWSIDMNFSVYSEGLQKPQKHFEIVRPSF